MTIQNQVVRVNSEQLDIKQLRLWLGQALKIFSTGNSVVLLKRKVNLRGFLDSKFHHLLKPTNPGALRAGLRTENFGWDTSI